MCECCVQDALSKYFFTDSAQHNYSKSSLACKDVHSSASLRGNLHCVEPSDGFVHDVVACQSESKAASTRQMANVAQAPYWLWLGRC